MGLSLLVSGDSPVLRITGSVGSYALGEARCWKRTAIPLDCELQLREGLNPHPGPSGLRWFVRVVPSGSNRLVSVVLTNTTSPGRGRDSFEAATFFQTGFSVRVIDGQLEPRGTIHSRPDADGDSNRLIYRDAKEYATGHTCSADWYREREEVVACTTWIPRQHVPALSADGHPVFASRSTSETGSPRGAFEAARLAAAPLDELIRLLSVVPDAYSEWLAEQELVLNRSNLSGTQAEQGRSHLEAAGKLVDRMKRGIAHLRHDSVACEAFQMSQLAMLQQARWRARDSALVFRWRPFQLGFQLLTLSGVIEPQNEEGQPSDERLLMDLLWFPTGGGKTEAYLGLIAFTLLLRRLRAFPQPDQGAGVGAFMRYTLRLLSTQQFERAARVMIACDQLRAERPARLGSVPILSRALGWRRCHTEQDVRRGDS